MSTVEQFIKTIEPFGSSLLNAILVLLLVGLVYALIVRSLHLMQTHRRLPSEVVCSLRRALRWLAVLVAITLLLQSFGLLENAWAAFTAFATMIAIGFVAVWSVMSNGLCSLIILITRPFRVGDFLELPPDELGGRVVNFNMIFTTLKADDDTYIQVPNNMFFQRVIRRRPGQARIGLDEQLMQEQDAKV